MIQDLIEAAWECGYYAATLEKAQLTSEQRATYDGLHKSAIKKRNEIKESIRGRSSDLRWCSVCQEFSRAYDYGWCEVCDTLPPRAREAV